MATGQQHPPTGLNESRRVQERHNLRPVPRQTPESGKHSRLLDTHRYFNIYKLTMHVAMSILSYLATALAHLKAGDYAHMRHMRIRLPPAKNAKVKRQSEQQVAPRIVAALVLHQLNAVQQEE